MELFQIAVLSPERAAGSGRKQRGGSQGVSPWQLEPGNLFYLSYRAISAVRSKKF